MAKRITGFPDLNLMIELTDLQKILDQKTVIDIPSLVVQAGEVATLLGPVDSGKHVLFRLLTGELRPTRGSIRLGGEDPYQNRQAFSRQVGVLFSEDNLYKRLSVLGNLQFYSRLCRLPKPRVVEVLEQVGLADHLSVRAETLSPGLSRRLALGRAILNRPSVLLLADPFTGCDQASIHLICQVVRQLAESGTAVLVFTHEAANLALLCDIVYQLNQGQIIDSYNPRQEEQSHQAFMVPARSQERIILIDPADILYIYAQDDRAYIQTSHESLPTRFTLSELEKRLARRGFFRAHRGYLVNLQQVKEVIPYTRDSFSLRLKDPAGTEIPLSKSAERELRELLGY
jgi:ABC-2 type transport system ATP-binding protein